MQFELRLGPSCAGSRFEKLQIYILHIHSYTHTEEREREYVFSSQSRLAKKSSTFLVTKHIMISRIGINILALFFIKFPLNDTSVSGCCIIFQKLNF